MSSIAELILVCIFWGSLSEIAYSYVLYPFVVLRILAWCFGRPPASSPSCEPTVAIVIAAHNEEKVIAEKLRNIAEIDYPAEKLSVWIGSDKSSDRTEEIIRSFNDPRIHLWVAPRRSGKAGILNVLVPQIAAEVLVFTDADIMFEPESIRKLTRHFFDPLVGGVGGATLQRQAHGETTEEGAYRLFEVMQKRLEAVLHSTISAFGPFYAIRRRLFVTFPPNTYSNDDVLMPMNIIRQGYRMFFDAEAVSYEEPSQGVNLEFKRRVRIGAGNYQAFFWLLDFLNPLKGWPWFCFVSHKVTRWFSPLFFITALISCMMLAFFGDSTLYKTIFSTISFFSLLSLLHKAIPLPILRSIFYLLAMNTALVCGFFAFLRGIKSAVWSRTERAGH
jgi:cellulose synthase/poly-beta-1,6-N-acetylglucosamine synthase-like glycosyltransferase